HSTLPLVRSSPATAGWPGLASGTNTRAFAMAGVPLIGRLKSCVQRSFPVEASMAKTLPPPAAATSVPDATTGVPVKSPSVDWNVHTGPSVGISLYDGALEPPSREFDRPPP